MFIYVWLVRRIKPETITWYGIESWYMPTKNILIRIKKIDESFED
jgi:hypothetical protein